MKRFMDTCYSSLFCKRTHRHVGNPLSFQVSPRAKRDQTKSPARSANSSRKAISSKDAGARRTEAATIGRHRRHLADAGHGHAVVDLKKKNFFQLHVCLQIVCFLLLKSIAVTTIFIYFYILMNLNPSTVFNRY